VTSENEIGQVASCPNGQAYVSEVGTCLAGLFNIIATIINYLQRLVLEVLVNILNNAVRLNLERFVATWCVNVLME
jgi:hypothetical protein